MMTICAIDVSNLPFSAAIAVVGIIGSFAVAKYTISELKKELGEVKAKNLLTETQMQENKDTMFKVREKDAMRVEERFRDSDFKREMLKDQISAQIIAVDDKLTDKFHAMDKKLTEIHTIIVKNKI